MAEKERQDSAPPIPASDGGRCRSAGAVALRLGASLPDTADHDDRAVPGRRGNRRDRADYGGADARTVGATDRH